MTGDLESLARLSPRRRCPRRAGCRGRRQRAARARATALTSARAIAGSRTVNVAPCPAPALSPLDAPALQLDEAPHEREADAETRRASGRARARPARRARTRARQIRPSMPMPVVATRSTASSPSRAALTRDRFAGRRVVGRVREKIHDDLLERVTSPSTRGPAEVALVAVAALVDRRVRAVSIARSDSAARSSGVRWRVILPSTARPASRRSSTRCVR